MNNQFLLRDDYHEEHKVNFRTILKFKDYQAVKDFAYLWPYLLRKWQLPLLSFFLFIISTGLIVYIPRSIGKIIDFGLKNQQDFFYYFGIFIAISSAKIATVFFQRWTFILFGEKALLELRQDLVNIILNMPMRFFDLNSSGKIISRAVNDVSNLAQVFSPMLFSSVSDLVMILGSVISVMFISPLIGLGHTILLALLIFFLMYIVTHLGRKQRRFRSILSQINTYTADTINGIEVILAQNYVSLWLKNYNKLIRLMFFSANKIILLWGRFPIGHTMIIGLAYVLTIVLGVYQVKHSIISLGDFVSILYYITMIFHPFHEISHRITEIQSSMSSMSKIKEILQLRPMSLRPMSLRDVEEKLPSFHNYPIIFKNIRFSYSSDRIIFDNLNLTFPAKKVTAVIGCTGSGKTTLSNLICRLYPWESGDILLGDYPISNIESSLLYKQIGIVTQQLFLFEDNLRENLRLYDGNITDNKIYDVLREVNLEAKVLSLPERLDTPTSNKNEFFSIGEKQLLVIVRMLIRNPAIVIFDEATASLDNHTEYLVQKYLKKLFYDRTTVIIAHRPSTIKLANYVVVLDQGKVIEEGTHQLLAAKQGMYSRLVDAR
ncbi:MAG: ABC transporter ATP-binding protein [Oligoflexia bacterium]|nr:ABC transporter ATP-binding protein [Oligoflexia bacterium]